MNVRNSIRGVLFAGMLIAVALAAWITVIGGIQLRFAGVVLRSRDALRPLLVALLLLGVYATSCRDAFSSDIARIARAWSRVAVAIAVACAIAVTATAWRWGTHAAGGADSFAYISQAYGWLHGWQPSPQPLPARVPWPSAAASLSPLGYRAAAGAPASVPSYAPGLPLIMAATTAVVGPCGPFVVTPVFAGALVLVTFLLGRKAGGATVGALSALLVAASPVVVFQSLWPMTDVPVAALWTAAAVLALRDSRASDLSAGVLAGMAMLVRPQLWFVPPAFVLFLLLGEQRVRLGLVRAAAFCAPVAAAIAAIAITNSLWYGGALRSGYGTMGELYSWSSVWPNLQRYPSWLLRSHSALVLLSVVPLVGYRRWGARAGALCLMFLLVAATWLCYLAYAPFEEWWYLRFMLPAIPATLILAVLGIRAIARALPEPWGRAAAIALVLLMLFTQIRFTRAQQMLGPLRDGEQRYEEVGRYLKDALPKNAIVLSIQHSGSARFYSGLPTIRYDLVDKAWIPRAGEALASAGYKPYAVFEDWELPQVRELLGIAPGAPLPWTLIARMREPVGVSVFVMAPGTAAIPVAISIGPRRECTAPAGY